MIEWRQWFFRRRFSRFDFLVGVLPALAILGRGHPFLACGWMLFALIVGDICEDRFA